MRRTHALAAACTLALAAAADGQTQPPPAQPPVPTPPPMQPPAALPATPTYPTQLYRMTDVSRSLNLTPQQVARLNTANEVAQAQYRENYAALRSLTADQQAARIQEMNRQFYTGWNKAARDVFDDTQRARYQQLQYQYGGFNSLTDPAVQTQLNLTPAQQKALAEQVTWNSQRVQEINRLAATDQARAAEAYRTYTTQSRDRFNSYLSPEQRKVWGEMTGDPYTFQPAFPPR